MEQKKNRKHDNAATLAVVAVAFAMVGTVLGSSLMGVQAGSAGGSDSGLFNNWISVEVIHADGSREPTQYVHNKVTELGLNYTRDVISGLGVPPINGSLNNWTAIELSTDGTAPAATDRSCPSAVTGSGLDIARATTIIKQNTGNFTASKTFSVTGTQAGIQKVCLSNNTASAGYGLMASALISSTNVANGDTLIVNYSVAAQSG